MNIYLTFSDQPSGVYRSQVIDSILFLRERVSFEIRLVAFISIRNFIINRRIIKSALPDSIVLPMVPKLENWRYNQLLINFICRLLKPGIIVARSVIATNLAIECKKHGLANTVIYDGRGAISAEWHEYKVVNSGKLLDNISKWEERAVIFSDRQLSVSSELVKLWKSEFSLKNRQYVVIPSTLDREFEYVKIDSNCNKQIRKELNIKEDHVVVVYSGSVAGWQSLDKLYSFIDELLVRQQNVIFLSLSPRDSKMDHFLTKHPSRFINRQVKFTDVKKYLMACDYGLLIRENSVTNKVSSPVKFSEYVACGLKIIMSDNIGDYSYRVIEDGIGYLITDMPKTLNKLSISEKMNNSEYANKHFRKETYIESYRSILGLATHF